MTDVAGRVAWSGTGIDLRTDTPTVDRLGHAVREVLTTPSYGAHARRIRSDFARHDPPAEAAGLLEDLVK
jgi:UDP:flavonoid glycosyltransferase YjiC (YdhE family)